MAVSQRLQITRTNVDAATWTPILPNKDCIYFTLLNPSGTIVLKIRTTDTDPNSETTVQPLQTFPPGAVMKNMSPYRSADPICFAQWASGGTVAVVIICV